MSALMANLKERAGRLKTETYALYLVAQDPRTPWLAKVIAAAVVAYAFSPIDLIPDFIPVLGYLDDLLIVPAGIALAIRMVPEPVMAEARERARAGFAEGRPVNRSAAVVVVITWVVGLCVILAIAWKVFS